jgi:hypothetical protein
MKSAVTPRVTADLYKRMLKISALYIVGFALVLCIMQIILSRLGRNDIVYVAAAADNSTRVYLMVVGIVYPLAYFSHYYAAGVTRKRFAIGLASAGALLSCSFAALRIPLELIFREFSPLATVADAAYGAAYFFAGWTAAISFLFGRAIYIFIGFFLTNVMYILLQSARDLNLAPWEHAALSLVAAALIFVALERTARRVPLKS